MSRKSKWMASMWLVAMAIVAPGNAQTPVDQAGATSKEQRVSAAVVATKAVKGTEGAERESALVNAARAWESVMSEFGESDPEIGARAAWEAGELWRKRGDLESADRCYARSLTLDQGRFRERATFARAGVARRQERFDEAIAMYREVISMRPESARAHESRLRAGRCLERKGESGAAIAAYREALDAVATNPRRAVDAGNHLARALVKSGDIDGAAAAITRVEKLAQPVLEGGGKDAVRLKKALDAMSARRAVQRARDRRDGAHQDAEQLDADDRP